jgi:iron complex transport system substrate-binding protein
MARMLALVGFALLLSAASPRAAVAWTVRDMLDREVTLGAPPKRIVSLVPSVTEVIYALGAEDRLTAVTDYCDFPPAARGKPRVGSMVAPSLEVLAAFKPDLVVATDEGNRHETILQIGRLGIPIYLVHVTSVVGVLDLVARLGEVTEHTGAAAAIRATFERRLAAVQRAVQSLPRRRVLYVLWPEPLIVPGRESLITELIGRAGGESVTARDRDAYPRFSLEAAVARAPDVIIIADHGSGTGSGAGRPSPEKWQRLTSVPAIRSGRLYSADFSILHRYGPRIVEGVELLARLIHPEAFR